MDLYCTRPGCQRPENFFTDLDEPATLKTVQQKFCTNCGMPLILVGRYLPQKLLGQGGFGAAFLSRDRYTPGLRRCVVKQFQPSNTLSAKQLQIAQDLFEREAEALEYLGNTHPQIPDLFAFFELAVPSSQGSKDEQFFYLVQEYIDGQTMEQEIAQTGAFPEDNLLKVLQEILKVLQFVHESGSIHRDIKPSNIMRHRNGHIYLLDFGAVRQVAKAGVKSTGIYSEGFAPPEQMAGGEVYPSSDLYALAVTCIMLLTNKQPSELLDTYSNTWQWRLHCSVSDRLANVLERMLHSVPSQRYQSAAEVLTALDRSSGSLTLPSTPLKQTAPHTPVGASSPPTTFPAVSLPNQSAPNQPIQLQPIQPVQSRPAIAPFASLELLTNAGFIGFEAGLLAIAIVSVLGTTLISGVFWLLLLMGLLFAQSRRIIERVDLVIIAVMSVGGVFVLSWLKRLAISSLAGSPFLTTIALAVMAGLLAIALTTLFRLIYKILSLLISKFF
ncbi:protein kinase [Phormidium sp. CLA17]|uniref:serine/threonine-protein kinase n=1 Tax=Leptolyngbya sp. Cla-17 TaxID=2803751 RepID=UPI001490E3B9|nr:serine/threonine-protein kinase [Leptolyngbya sp. Cla-17]MBM0741096.1 protein kinase [Leptolyngbya sp. Cla-17]